jgi:signal transduction histidine kinase
VSIKSTSVRRSSSRSGSKQKAAPREDQSRRETERLQSLIGELSAALAQAPADAVDGEIEKWLGRICVALDLDRSAMYEREAPGWMVRTSHTWVRPNFPPFPKKYNPETLLQKTVQWIVAGNRVVFSSPDQIPFELGDFKRFVDRYGPRASAVFPMWAGDRVIGGASFGKFRAPREWKPQLLDQLALIVRLFGSAIERKQAETLSRKAREELAVAQRRSMMGQLVASLTHEINQPLSAILSNLGGLARLIAQKNPDPALASTAINNAVEDAKRTGEIVRRFRAMFKGDSARKASIDLGTLASEVARLVCSESAMRRVKVEMKVSPSLPAIFGDRILLQQCILNLLMNAFDELVKVEEGRRNATIEIALDKPGWVAVSVRDNGPGVDPSVAGRLFEPFFSTKAAGMGLGLLVTRSIVEDHGGKIFAASNDKGLTTFTFTLPVAQPRAGASRRRTKKA